MNLSKFLSRLSPSKFNKGGLILRYYATGPFKDLKHNVWPFDEPPTNDEEKLKEIKRLEKVASSHIGEDENKLRDWRGNINFQN